MKDHRELFERDVNHLENGQTIVMWRARCACDPQIALCSWQPDVYYADIAYDQHIRNCERKTHQPMLWDTGF